MQSLPCTGDIIQRFTTNIFLLCAKQCIDRQSICDAINIHRNLDDVATKYTCELLQNVSSLDGTVEVGLYQSSTCVGM